MSCYCSLRLYTGIFKLTQGFHVFKLEAVCVNRFLWGNTRLQTHFWNVTRELHSVNGIWHSSRDSETHAKLCLSDRGMPLSCAVQPNWGQVADLFPRGCLATSQENVVQNVREGTGRGCCTRRFLWSYQPHIRCASEEIPWSGYDPPRRRTMPLRCEGEARALLLLQPRCSAIQTLQPREPQAPPRAFADGGAHSIWAPSCGSPQWYQRRTMQARLGRAGGEEDAARPAHLSISSALLGRRALPHPPQRAGREISAPLRVRRHTAA